MGLVEPQELAGRLVNAGATIPIPDVLQLFWQIPACGIEAEANTPVSKRLITFALIVVVAGLPWPLIWIFRR